MKKFIAVLTLMCASCAFLYAAAREDQEFIIKTGIQAQGIWEDKYNEENTNPGVSFGVEYFKYFNNVVAVGAGASYDLPRKFKNWDGDISFLPLYTAVKVRMPLKGLDNNYPFATARLGYSAFMDNTDWVTSSSGGLQYGLSAGYCIGALFLEASYLVNRFSYKMEGDAKSLSSTYSTVAFYVGVKID